MKLSLQVFEPEMSLGTTSFKKSRSDIEREVGIGEAGDASKPLLLKLIEQVKYGSPIPVQRQEPLNQAHWG